MVAKTWLVIMAIAALFAVATCVPDKFTLCRGTTKTVSACGDCCRKIGFGGGRKQSDTLDDGKEVRVCVCLKAESSYEYYN